MSPAQALNMALKHTAEKTAPIGTGLEMTDARSVSDDLAEAGDVNLVRAESASEPPDGGLVAWTQVLAGNLVNCISWGYPATFGVYQLYYTDTLQLPDAQISWIGSVQLFLTFVSCTVSGRLADAGYVKTTLAVGSFMVILGTFMTSIATQYWQIFLAQGVCIGFGLGIMFMPPLTVISSYFKEKRALALAIAATGTGMGSVIFPAIIQYLIPKVGFGWAVRVSGFVALIICGVATTVLKPRLKPRKAGPWVEWSAFREGPYVLFMMGAFFTFWALYFGFFYVGHPGEPLSVPCEHLRLTLTPDQRIRPKHCRLQYHLLGAAPANHERHVRPVSPGHGLPGELRPGPGKHVCHHDHDPGGHGLCVDRRPHADRHIRLRGVLRPRQRRRSGGLRRRARQPDQGPAENGDEVRHGLYSCRVRDAGRAANCGRHHR